MIVIICDATKDIGYGHLKRCLVLAYFYRKLGLRVIFLMRDRSAVVENLLGPHGIGLVVRSDHGKCLSYLFEKKDQIKLVIIDHYEIGAEFEKNIFNLFSVLVIDDLCRSHWCDLLVDQTINRTVPQYDKKLKDASTKALLGIGYTLIDPVYRGIKTNQDKHNILITFGATDSEGAVLKVLEILENTMGNAGLIFHLPMSSMSFCLESLLKWIDKSNLDIRLYQDLPDLCCLYEQCGIAIGAPGTSVLERIFCGLINLTVVVAENQTEVGKNLADQGLTICLGNIQTLDAKKLTRELKQMIEIQTYGAVLQERARGLIDGKGPDRVIKQTIPLISAVKLRSVQEKDENILYNWQHQQGARKYFRKPTPPTKKEHHVWFDRMISNDDIVMNIIEWCDMEIGYIRMDSKGNKKEVSILIAQNFQGWGFAKTALLKIINTKQHVFTAFIYPENKASIGLFTSVGFQSAGKGEYIYDDRS